MASAWGVSWGSAWGNAWGAISAAVTGGGGYDDKKKKRFFVEKNGKLLVYGSASKAIGSLDEPEKVTQKLLKQAEPEQVIELPAVKEYAQVVGQIEQYNAAYNSQHWEQLIAMFEQMRDEEELELLLYAL